jgi:hypothetical protein
LQECVSGCYDRALYGELIPYDTPLSSRPRRQDVNWIRERLIKNRIPKRD